MIIDLREYTYHPAKFRKFLKSYEEFGFALTSKHLGKTLGILRAESGVQNRTFQFFMYESSTHRDTCRRGMIADPAWGEFVKIDGDALLQQKNTLLIPTDYSPVGGSAPAPVLNRQGPNRLFELRTWAARPESGEALSALMADGGAALLARHDPDVIGWFTADTGEDHRLMRMSAYANATERDNARDAAIADPDVRELYARVRSLVTIEERQLLLPMDYSPLR